MEKTYFLVKPSEFIRLGNIDIDGEVEEIQCEDFNVETEKENVMIFEVCYDDYYCSGLRDFAPYAKEFVSGKKFKLEVFQQRGKGPRCINLCSEELGLYMHRAIPIEEVEVNPIKVSGLLMYLQKNPDERAQYYYELREMLETAKAFKNIYDNSVYGPSRYVTKETRRSYKKTK